jgi:FKBP-type peptidyl-prolyl cis-trans isomerase 2
VLLAAAPAMGAQAPIAAGQRVQVDFTVRLSDGSLLITTRPETAEAPGQAKSSVYMTLKQSGPVTVTAGPAVDAPRPPIDKGFEGELLDQLGRAVVGAAVGESRSVVLKSTLVPDLPDGERFLRLSRVRQRDRQTRIQRSQFVEANKKEPAKGDRYPFEPPIDMQVVGADQEVVTVELISPDGAAIATDFGPGVIKDKGAQGYEVRLAAKVGALIRMNQLLGRITKADEQMFTIDFGDLFGGEALLCELTVVGLAP